MKESMDSDTDVVMMDYAVGFDEWEHVTFSYYRERIRKTSRNFDGRGASTKRLFLRGIFYIRMW